MAGISYQQHPFKKGEKWHRLDVTVTTDETWANTADHYLDVNSVLNTATAGADGGPLTFDALYVIPKGSGTYELKGEVEFLLSYATATESDGTDFTDAEFTLRTQTYPVSIVINDSAAEGTEVTTLAPNSRLDCNGFRYMYMRTPTGLDGDATAGCIYALWVKEQDSPNSSMDMTPDNRNA
jgi:hypothetical protein